MTRFEKHYESIKKDPLEGKEILSNRQKELRKLEKQHRESKNTFRRQCIAQDLERLQREYKQLDELI